MSLLLLACTFEQTGSAAAEEELRTEAARLGNGEADGGMGEGMALQTVRLFRESVATGDLSLALSLLDRNASLVDAIVGEASQVETRGELLLELRRRHAAGTQLQLLETEVSLPADGVALVLSRLAVLEEGPDGFGEDVGRMEESVLLVISSEGWRIRHVHRSLHAVD